MNLQQLIYKQLPDSIKSEIYNNPELHPEYNSVVSQLNNEILSSYKSKVKLSKKEITLMSILITVYIHILDNPPRKDKTSGRTIKGWDSFMSKNYPMYDEYIDDTDYWPKFMFLLYYTYTISYNTYYKLKQLNFNEFVLPYDRKKDKLINYIYKTYKILDTNVTLNEFRDYGY